MPLYLWLVHKAAVISPLPTDPVERFALIIRGMLRMMEMQSVGNRVAGRLISLVWLRVRRIGAEFERLVARLRAGTLPPPRVRRPAAWSRPGGVAASAPASAERLRLAGAAGAEPRDDLRQLLQHLLSDPDMAALVAAAPRQMGRLLRPLCWMLRVDAKGLLPPRPRPPARPADRGRHAARREAGASHPHAGAAAPGACRRCGVAAPRPHSPPDRGRRAPAQRPDRPDGLTHDGLTHDGPTPDDRAFLDLVLASAGLQRA